MEVCVLRESSQSTVDLFDMYLKYFEQTKHLFTCQLQSRDQVQKFLWDGLW